MAKKILSEECDYRKGQGEDEQYADDGRCSVPTTNQLGLNFLCDLIGSLHATKIPASQPRAKD